MRESVGKRNIVRRVRREREMKLRIWVLSF
jgi:hypothetical protein